jgi:predicted NodU family carbamoyl transferase
MQSIVKDCKMAESSETNIDTEEMPQSRQRKKIAKATSERKKRVKAEETWFEQSGNKIIKKTKMNNGNVQSLYVGIVNKKNAGAIDELKKKYGIKVV